MAARQIAKERTPLLSEPTLQPYGSGQNKRRRSTVPGLSNAEYMRRSRYCHTYAQGVPQKEWQDKQYGQTNKESIQESIRFHLEVLESFREQPWPMKQKLESSRQAREFLKWQVGKLDKIGNLKQTQKHVLNKVNKATGDTFVNLTIWKTNIKNIEAYFGSGVATYFTFLRYLFWLNLLIFIVLLGFVSVPQILEDPAILFLNQDNNTNCEREYEDGLGELRKSILFYGNYSKDISFSYSIPLAYLLTFVAVLLLCFGSIVTRMMKRYKKMKRIDTKEEYPFSWKLFCGWDYTLSTTHGIDNKKTSLKIGIKEQVRDLQETLNSERNKCILYTVRIITNIVVLGMLGASGTLIYYLVDNQNKIIFEGLSGDAANYLQKYQVSVTVAVLKSVVPIIFIQLAKLEKWHPRVEMKWTLARTMIFYYASLGVLALSLYNKAKDNADTCWETVVGEELFKVVLFDVVACFLIVPVADGLRAGLVKCCNLQSKVGKSEFSVTSSVLDLIYGQGLIWMGLYFSPLLPLVAVLKLVLLFYYQYGMVRYCNDPPKNLFKASKSGNFYLALLLFTQCLCFIPVGYILIVMKPSTCCGPFKNQEHSFSVFTDLIGSLPDWMETGINFISSAAIVVPVLLLLVMCVFFYKYKSSSYKEVIADLRMQLHFERSEGKRKVFAFGRKYDGKNPEHQNNHIPEEDAFAD